MQFPKELKYAKTHEWARQDGTAICVGVTEYAQKELSDVVYVELPAVGKTVTAGQAACVVESVKAAFDIYAPVSGTVVEVNTALETNPALVNTDSYHGGWFFKIAPSAPQEFSALMDAAAYEHHVAHSGH